MISMFIYERTSAYVHVVRQGMCKSYRKTHVKGGSAVIQTAHQWSLYAMFIPNQISMTTVLKNGNIALELFL